MQMQSEEQDISPNGRREFLKQVGTTFGAIILTLPVITVLDSCSTTLLKGGNSISVDVSSLKNDGEALVTSDLGPDGARIVVRRITSGSYEAHSMLCTHLKCSVIPPDKKGALYCNCHGSQFDTSGNVLNGPATIPLRSYATVFSEADKKLTINFT